MARVHILRITDKGKIHRRDFALLPEERIFFDGPDGFSLEFTLSNPFGDDVNSEHPLTGHYHPEPEVAYEYKIFKNGEQTDGPKPGQGPGRPIIETGP